MLANFSFHQCYSIPESGGIEWMDGKTVGTAKPRQEVGCAVCARKDWLETRFRVYLWREPDADSAPNLDEVEPKSSGASHEEEMGRGVGKPVDAKAGQSTLYARTMSDGCYCLGNADKVNRFLSTSNYVELMPLIPQEELYASSVQHPEHPEMTWLLHTRRVPCLTAQAAEALGFVAPESGVGKPPAPKPGCKLLDLRCAGVGDKDATVWCCKDCISNLCRPEKEIAMPPPALVNLLWLGREHPLCQQASIGARMLSCLGRAVWRQLILRPSVGDKDEA